MNSKEYLKQIATTEVIDCTNNDKAKKRIANIFPVGISVIEKDLKILKILKKHIYYSNKSHCIRMSDIYKKTTSFDYEDIKEWLEK